MQNDLNTDKSMNETIFGKRTVNNREALLITFPNAKYVDGRESLEFMVITDDAEYEGNNALIVGTTEWDLDHIENDGESFQGQYGAPILSRDFDGTLTVDFAGVNPVDMNDLSKFSDRHDKASEYLMESGIDPNWVTASGASVKMIVLDRLNENRDSNQVVKEYLKSISNYL